MATWVKSSQDIENHPKTIRLMKLTGLDRHTVIGRLHCFWWWVQKYAESGDLSPFTPSEIDTGLGFPEGQNFIENAITAGWIDTAPYLRVHDWWDYNGPWLIAKYKKSPSKWMDIKKSYKSTRNGNSYRTVTKQAGNSTEKRREDVEKNKEKAVTAFRVREIPTASKPHPTAATAPLENPREPFPNGSMNGSGNSYQEPPPETDEAAVVDFIRQNLPDGAEPPQFQANWEGQTITTETERYCENGMKALWMIYINPNSTGRDWAKGQGYSIKDFIRQIPVLTDSGQFPTLKRWYLDEISRHHAASRNAVQAEVPCETGPRDRTRSPAKANRIANLMGKPQ